MMGKTIVTLTISVVVLATAGCGDSRMPTSASVSSATPASPSPSSSPAVLAVARFTVLGTNYSELGSSVDMSWCVVSSLVLTETGGTSGALVTGLEFHLNTANPVHGNLLGIPVRKRVEAGATSELVEQKGSYSQYELGTPFEYTSVSVVVSYVDDAGRSGSVSAVTPRVPPVPPPVTTPQTFTLSGTVTSITGAALGGATVRVQDGANAGRSATTSASGAYSMIGLTRPTGMTVTASATNYKDMSVPITVISSQFPSIDFELVPTQSVTPAGLK